MRASLFVVAFALFWLLAPRSTPDGVPSTVAATAAALAESGTLDLASRAGSAELPDTVVHDGRRRATGHLGAALVLVPAELLARPFAGVTMHIADRAGAHKLPPARIIAVDAHALVERLLLAATAAALGALLCLLLYSTLRRRGLTARAALGFTAALALATPILYFARVPDGTALTALLLYWALVEARAFVAAPRGGELGIGLTLGALVVVDPSYSFAALVVLAWCGLHRHERFDRKTALETLAPVAVGLAIALWHRVHVGAPDEPRGDFVQGLVGLVISPGKSLFVYAPLLVLAIPTLRAAWRRRRAEAELTLVVCAAVLLAAARVADWHGDPTWGPRRLVPLAPILVETIALGWHDFAAAERRRHARPLYALCAVGLFVQLLGVALAPTTYLDELRRVRMETGAPSWFAVDPSGPDEAHFIPQFSPVLGHAWLLEHMIRRAPKLNGDVPWKLLIANEPPDDDLLPRLELDSIVVVLPPALGLPWVALVAAALGLGAWRMRRALRRDTVGR